MSNNNTFATNKISSKAKIVVIEEEDIEKEDNIKNKKPIKNMKKKRVPTEIEQDISKLTALLRLKSTLQISKNTLLDQLIIKLHDKHKYTFTSTQCEKYYDQLLHKNVYGVLFDHINRTKLQKVSEKAFKIIYDTFKLSTSYITTLMNNVKTYVDYNNENYGSKFTDMPIKFVIQHIYANSKINNKNNNGYNDGYLADRHIKIMLSMKIYLCQNNKNLSYDIFSKLLDSMEKVDVINYESETEGSTSNTDAIKLSNSNTLYSPAQLLEITHQYDQCY